MTLLPPNASTFEKALENATAIPALPVPLRELWNPATCPEHLLPWLAWALSVDNWDTNWPLTVRRAVIANAIEVQRHKGTVGAVRTAIANFGAAMVLREWFELAPAGTPGTFEVVLSIAAQNGVAPSPEFIAAVIDEIDRTKPLSRHFTFTQALEGDGAVGLIAVARPVAYVRLDCAASPWEGSPSALDFGNPDNSGLLALFLDDWGGVPSLVDFSDPENSGLITIFIDD